MMFLYRFKVVDDEKWFYIVASKASDACKYVEDNFQGLDALEYVTTEIYLSDGVMP